MLVAASVLLAALLLYVLFIGYLPATHRVTGLERELKDLYKRATELETKLAQQDQRYALREQQLAALTDERDALVKRLEDLERELAALRRRR
jgi:septal ring factor EnvC (AmiA/AmiB activator)